MTRRILSLVLTMAMLLSLCTGIVPSAKAAPALPTYSAADNYGSEVFSYYSRDITNGATTEMVFNESSGLYMDGVNANYIGTSYLTTGVNPAIGSMLTFTAPYDGTITISNGLDGIRNTGEYVGFANFATCYAMVYSPDWTNIGDYAIPANADFVETPDITGVEVKAGDVIKFVVGSNTPMNSYVYWEPIISYTACPALHSHNWQAAWASNETHHWHECDDTCYVTEHSEKDGYAAHTDANKDRVCDTCNAKVALSYNANEDYGSDVFGYYTRDITNGATTEMVYNEDAGLYMNGATANYIGTSYLTAGVNPAIGSMITFTAPYDGTITISNGLEGIRNTGHQVDMTNFADCYAMVYSPDWTNIGDYAIPANAEFVATPDITGVEVKAGDVIKFIVGSNAAMNSYIYWIPIITYTEVIYSHAWSAEWTSDAIRHWHECTADDCDITNDAGKDGYGLHVDANEDRVCDTCNAKVAISYNANEDYGSDVFGYYTRDITNGVVTEMTFNEGAGLYMNGATANYIGTSYLTAGVDPAVGSMITFTAPYDGTITISNGLEGIRNTGHQVDMTNFADCYAMVYAPGWTNIGDYAIPANAEFVATPDITGVEVKAGDVITFIVGSNAAMNSYIYWIPIITYTEVIHNHVWSAEWTSDGAYHWHECTADDCDITDVAGKDGYGLHVDANKDQTCDTCNAKVALSYNANEDYGSDVFGYYTRDITNGVVTEMVYNEDAGLYMNGATANYIGTSYLTAGVDPAIGSMITFTAPYSGTITISNGLEGIRNTGHQVDMTNFADCYAMVYSPDWTNIGDYAIPANANFVATPDITDVTVKAGDVITFIVGSNTPMNSYIYWIPIITYTEVVHDHVWSAEWTSDGAYHWHECTADDCDITDVAGKDGYGLHVDANKDCACDSCGAKVALSYNANEDYGSDVFGYYTRDITNGVVTEMTANEGAGLHMNGVTANYIGTSYLTAGVDPAIGSMLTFTAPYSGTITISNGLEGIRNTGEYVNMTNFAECYAMVYAPGWTNIGDYAIPANAEFVATPDITDVAVKAGDVITFIVGSNTPMNSYIYWIPIITYTEVVHDHVWSAEWTSDATHHWHECTADDCDITDVAGKDGYGLHIDANKDRVCDTCNAKVALSYNANADYGSEVFNYFSRDITNGVTTEMTFNEGVGLYMNGATGNYIGTSYLTTGVDPAIGSMITFTAPYDGIINISNGLEGIRNTGLQVDLTNFADCYAMVYSNDWTNIGDYAIPANAEFVATPDITGIEVREGDVIKFIVGSNTAMNSYIYWIPVITYTYSSAFEPENPATYYISSSQGNDSNDGLTESTAWASLDNLDNVGLYAGDTVLFKSGDTWVGSWDLDLSHGSEKHPITFASYGEGNKPSLRYYANEVTEKASGIVLTLNNPNGFVMDGLDIGFANMGVKLSYDVAHIESEYVRFTNCHFHDIYGVTQHDNNPDIYVSAAIGTQLKNATSFPEGDAQGNDWVLRGLYVDNCTANDAGTLVCGPSGVYGFYMTDCVVENNGYYGTTVFGCRKGYIDRCVFKNNGTRDMPAGSCGIMVSCEDFTIKNSIISGQQRQGDNPDGCGMDFEWDCRDVVVENCLFQDNAGVGIMYFTSGQGAEGTNYNTNVLNCYFINNNQNPDDQGIEYEVFASTYATSGCTVSGNKYYYSRLNGSKTNAFSHAWANNSWTVSNNTRLMSIPANLEDIILNAESAVKVDSYNVSLGDNLNMNFYLDIPDCYKSDAVITVKVAGEQVASYTADQIANEDGEYVVTVELAAAQMTEEVTIQIAAGDMELVNERYSVRGYADYILDEANGFAEKDKAMVQAMLHYGAAAQEYFGVNLDNLANAGYTDSVTEELPSAQDYRVNISGSVSGIRSYGASLLHGDKIAVRFYFAVTGDGAYTVNGKALTEKGDLWYVDFTDIAPQDLDQVIEAVVSDANGSSFTVSYSPLQYIVRQYNKTENAELKALVQNLYDYYKAAEAYVA